MQNLNYHAELARFYPLLATKRAVATTATDGKQYYQLYAKPAPNGTFIDIEFMQGNTFVGYRSVSLLELEPLWRQCNND